MRERSGAAHLEAVRKLNITSTFVEKWTNQPKMSERIKVSVLLTGVCLVFVNLGFALVLGLDPAGIVCISTFAIPMIFPIAYLFLAPTIPSVQRAKASSAQVESELGVDKVETGRNGLKAELKVLLDPGESIISTTSGTLKDNAAILAITNRRLLVIYSDEGVGFTHSEIEWLRWSPLSSKLSFKVREYSRKFDLEVFGADSKLEAEELASEANSRFGISHGS
jgi:hypothetical protein